MADHRRSQKGARIAWLCAANLLCAMQALRAAPPANGWTLVWSDEFNESALDTSTWSYFTGVNQGGYDDSGPPTIALSGSTLDITTWTDSSGVVHTGWIWTPNFQQAYGYWEARIRFNESSGEWSAFWLQPSTINTVTSPPDPADNGAEIDVVEHRARDSSDDNLANDADENLHWNGYGSSEVSAGPGTVSNPGSVSLQGNWHTYGLLWTPYGYTFYIDGIQTGSSTAGISMRPQWIYLSTFVNGSSWAGPVINYGTSTSSTTEMQVDYVRWYAPSERILDPDFEGRMAPWSGYNAAWATGANGVVAYSGTSALSLNAASAAAGVSQTVYGLVPNTGYVLTGWVTGDAAIGVNSYGGSQVSQTVDSATYAQATVPFTTGASNYSASVFGYAAAGAGTSYVDDFLLLRDATVNNGQLETGDAWAWSLYGGAAVSTGAAYGGNYSVNLPASSVTEGANNNIVGLTPNTTYTLSAWAETSGSPVILGVKNFNGTSQQPNTSISSSGFTRGVVNFTTGAANTTATIYAYRAAGSTGNAYADNFFLFQPLTAPWADQDVTAIALSGTAGTAGTQFVVEGSGGNIGGTSDQFHFVNQQLSGNCQVTARISASDNTSPNAQSGVMMRATLNSYVANIMVDWTPSGTVNLVSRAASNATSSTLATVSGVSTPPWVRLIRRGNLFTGFYSTDGNTWNQVGQPQTIALGGSAYVGLAVCADNTADLAGVVFDDVSTAVFNGNDTWAGGGADANWQTGNNWSGINLPPLAGDSLAFDGATQLNNTNNFAALTSFAGITFNPTAGAFTLGGNAIILAGGVTNNSPDLETINLNLQLASAQTFTGAAGPILVGGVISGTGEGVSLGTGPGTVIFSATNTFTGDFSIAGGIASVSAIGNTGAAGGLGAGANINIGASGSAGTLIYTGAGESTNKVVRTSSSTAGSNALIDQEGTGLLNFTAYSALGAASHTLTLEGGLTNPAAAAGEISAAIANQSATNLTSLTKAGGNQWILSGSDAYTGPTAVNSGTLAVLDGGALANTAISVAAGATFIEDSASAITGTASLTAADGGNVTLAAPNSFSGGVTIGVNGTGALTGAVLAEATQALGAGLVNIGLNGNSATGILQLYGGISLNNAITFWGRTSAALGIENIDGNNTLSGAISTTVGGASYVIQSDAGTLSLTNNAGIAIPSGKTLTLQGAGNGIISGPLTSAGGLTKSGGGAWTLSGADSYTGPTNVLGGILEIAGTASGTSSLTVGNGASLYLAGGALSVSGPITNDGIFKLSGTAALAQTGAFVNNGVLDLINGPRTLPASFTNNGTVLAAGSVQVQQFAMSGSTLTLTIQGYAEHTYQLQRASSLAPPVTWANVGAPQTGAGAPLIFTDPAGAAGSAGFYQIQISP